VKIVRWDLVTENDHTLLTLTVNISYCSQAMMNLQTSSNLSTQSTDDIYASIQHFIDNINDINDTTNGFGVIGFLPQTPIQLSTSIYDPRSAPNDLSIRTTSDCTTASSQSPLPDEPTVQKSNSKNIGLIIPIIVLSVLVGVLIGYIVFLKVRTSSQQPREKESQKMQTEAATVTDQPTPTDLVETDSAIIQSAKGEDVKPIDSPDSGQAVESIQVIVETEPVEPTAVPLATLLYQTVSSYFSPNPRS
jgi:hypothetical protein